MHQAQPPGLPATFYARPAEIVAPELLGCVLVHESPAGLASGRIVEVEAYGPNDPASHAFRGPTPRNSAMFGPAGRAYVYRSYGIHSCFNVSTDADDIGSAVLIRAMEPLDGIELMRQRRQRPHQRPLNHRDLARGPGRLTEALAITHDHNGIGLQQGALRIEAGTGPAPTILTTPRIGISQATDIRWRFIAAGSRFVSGSRRLNQSTLGG